MITAIGQYILNHLNLILGETYYTDAPSKTGFVLDTEVYHYVKSNYCVYLGHPLPAHQIQLRRPTIARWTHIG